MWYMHMRSVQTYNLDANKGIGEVLLSGYVQTAVVSPSALIQFEALLSAHVL